MVPIGCGVQDTERNNALHRDFLIKFLTAAQVALRKKPKARPLSAVLAGNEEKEVVEMKEGGAGPSSPQEEQQTNKPATEGLGRFQPNKVFLSHTQAL